MKFDGKLEQAAGEAEQVVDTLTGTESGIDVGVERGDSSQETERKVATHGGGLRGGKGPLI